MWGAKRPSEVGEGARTRPASPYIRIDVNKGRSVLSLLEAL
jgi:hypothetical protein